VVFSPDGKSLATNSDDGTAKLWEVATGQVRDTFATPGGYVSAVAFSPDGKTVAVGEHHPFQARPTGQVKLLDLATRKRHSWHVPGGAFAVAFSPDGTTLAVAGSTFSVSLWDAGGQLRNNYYTTSGRTYTVAFSPDGRTLASGHYDANVRLWDTSDPLMPRTLKAHTGDVNAAAFSPDGRTLATSGKDRLVRLWDLTTGRPEPIPLGRGEAVTTLAFSPDGKTLATGSVEQTIRLWDVTLRQERSVLRGHTGKVTSVAFSPDGKTLASTAWDWTVRLWNVPTGQAVKVLRGHVSSQVWSVAFAPDGNTLASGSEDGTVKLWDLTTGREKATLDGGGTGILGVAFSPDGRLIAGGNWNRWVTIWEVAGGKELARLNGHSRPVGPVAFTPDGKTLVSGSDGEVKLWDVATHLERFTFKPHSALGLVLALGHDGRRLAAGGADGTLTLWDAPGDAGSEPRIPGTPDPPTFGRAAARDQEALWRREADTAEETGAWGYADLALTRLVAVEPRQHQLWARRGRALAELGQWDLAAADTTRAVELGATDPNVRLQNAQLRLAVGDKDGYRRACADLLRSGIPEDEATARQLVQTCTLAPNAIADYAVLERWAARAAQDHPEQSAPLQLLGAVLLRAGQPEAALRHLEEANRWCKPEEAPVVWLSLALVHHRLKHGDEARQWFAKAVQRLDQPSNNPPRAGKGQLHWPTVLQEQLLRGETETLLNQPPIDK
jgi:WD40 repeat protein/Flp pilus assembly protein TadD